MSQTATAIELTTTNNTTTTTLSPLSSGIPQPNATAMATATSSPSELSSSSLPPTDCGLPAWRLLLSAFVFEAILWGFPLSYGVFQEYYSRLPSLASNPYISVVGSTASGISYLGAPLIMPFIQRFSRYRTAMILTGWPMCILGLVAGSFANTLPTLILTQGVMYGVGFIIFYYPILSMVDEFWVHRRGMAYGLLCSASGASGAVMPLTLQALLSRFGYRTTLRVIAVALVVTTGPLIPLLKGRLPPSQQQGTARTDWSFLRLPLFWIYSISNLLMSLGYFFPALYLPSYSAALGLSGTTSALLLSLMSLSQVAGQLVFGYLSDPPPNSSTTPSSSRPARFLHHRRLPLNTLLLASLLVAATATFTSWLLATSLAPLIVFAVFYGFFGTGYTAVWARMVTAVSPEPGAHQAMFGLFNFGKGVGNVCAGPVSAGLLRMGAEMIRGDGDADAARGRAMYKSIVVFTGVCLVLSAGTLGGMYCGPKRVRRVVRALLG